MARVIMVQGTMSNAGKSLVVAGLCRIFKQDGYKVVPFKSQNMALNSFITEDGLEMGRAQVMQAEAAGVAPSVYMNPILLKPTNDIGSQVIVNGKAIGNMSARDYFKFKKELIPDVKNAFKKLEETADIIVIEGAGSPAEINLKSDDIVNMGLAKIVDAPVLLVGDIDLGGVFAQLLGTLMLLEDDERARVKGLIINKFRGDKTILDPGIEMLEERGNVRVAGVVPYLNLSIDDEDSLSNRLKQEEMGLIDLAVIRLPKLSNFTDFDVFEQISGVKVRYVNSVGKLGRPDILFIPGSKSTIADLKWMRQNGLEAQIKKLARDDVPVFGICGGFQMLGNSIKDPENVEGGGEIRGMELLPVETVLEVEKTTRQTRGRINNVEGIFEALSGLEYKGYEIHMGTTYACESVCEGDTEMHQLSQEECIVNNGNIYGSYIHGIFDNDSIARIMIETVARKKGIEPDDISEFDYARFREEQYDKLADEMRAALDMEYIYSIMNETGI
ncbi:MAG: cobyric acid synthase [Agathobacter sp.]|nr:cobyric acid synthase [Agathobacter sp.]